MTIKQLIEKYTADRKYYLTNKYNETLLRSDFLDPFFELLGWDIKNNAGKPTNEREVILEEALKENASEHSKKPDYTFRLFSERKYFLEAVNELKRKLRKVLYAWQDKKAEENFKGLVSLIENYDKDDPYYKK
jgi:predicted type IV restriction endonuclease